ncbi:MAG: uroporphyrinogen-III synthase [Pseudomonadales bacterium]
MVKVWLSRSQPGAERQAADLRAAGYQVVVAPVLHIEPLPASAPPPGPFDWIIYLSEHAVRHGLRALPDSSQARAARVLAVGRRTAAVLERHGVPSAAPDDATSEGLLALPQLQNLAAQHVLLVGGVGGRTLLAETLTARGARVARFDCYRRVPARVLDPAVLDCNVIIAASAEGLARVADLWLAAGGRPDVPVLVPSARVAGLAVEVGLESLHDCAGADSAAWLRGLERLQRAGRV